ncbi:MAG: 23S rRNA (adenine(2503)-C(2))-methyltransferase RlmN [Phycisphaerales bacterium]
MADDGRPLGGGAGALDAYRRYFREGPASVPGLAGFAPVVVRVMREDSPEGEVVKFLTRVRGVQGPEPSGHGRTIPAPPAATLAQLQELAAESVLIPMVNSRGAATYTLCVSSQVGCAMGCTFCETGQMGLLRSLAPQEIVGQWVAAAHGVGVRPKNIVFMGMGEPMDNFESVVQAIAVLKDHSGPCVPIGQITVSTVGHVEGIRRLAGQARQHGWHRLGLALSLNAPNDADRGAIMPINRRWPLREVQAAILDWPRYAGNKVCIEYVLIPGVNDSHEHARQVAEFMRPFGLCDSGRIGGQDLFGMLNLIPYNPRRNSPWPAPTEEQVGQFLNWLLDLKVFAKRRRTKGRRMMGACGQLGSEHIRKRRVVNPAGAGVAARPPEDAQ